MGGQPDNASLVDVITWVPFCSLESGDFNSNMQTVSFPVRFCFQSGQDYNKFLFRFQGFIYCHFV